MVTQEMNKSSTQIFYVKSSDEKPTAGVSNGSLAIEVDTGSRFRFDEENEIWYETGDVWW